jgi:nucleotide-binding universal stress UspA family protein
LKIQQILFPVDFSQRCTSAAPLVTAFASQWQASLTLLHVVAMPPVLAIALDARVGKRAIEKSNDQLRKYLPGAFDSLPVTRAVEQGDPAQVIAAYADRHKTDLIMLPSHGDGPFRRFLLGSVTSKLLHDCPRPVWTDIHTDLSRMKMPTRPCSVLAAVDCDDEAIRIVQYAEALATKFRGKLHLVHVLPAVDMKSRNRGEVAVRRHFLDHARKEFLRLGRTAEKPFIVQFKGGPISRGIAEAAVENKVGLLVVGRKHQKDTVGFLRTNVLAIVRESPCPVVSI